eukprot:5572416-Pyramimonas_sp.AAC.1
MAPTSLPEWLQSAPRGPNMTPGRLPRRPHECPESAQEASKTPKWLPRPLIKTIRLAARLGRAGGGARSVKNVSFAATIAPRQSREARAPPRQTSMAEMSAT